MKVLVTGGAGYIGSHTCKALAAAGHETLVFDNLSTGFREFVRWSGFVEGDIRDVASLRKSLRNFRPDAVIHFAACSQVGESVRDPGKYYHNNILGTLNLLESMLDAGVDKIVVSGSAAVYGAPGQMPIRETAPLAPLSPYGFSKVAMERFLQDFALSHGLRWISLRYFNAAGGSADCEIGELHQPETHLVPRAIQAILGKIPAIELFGTDYPTPDGTCIRDYIHVDDLASAHMLAMRHLLNDGESMALNLGTGQGNSVREILSGLKELTGREVPFRPRERRAGDPPVLVADSGMARQVLDWSPVKKLPEILGDAWNFLSGRYSQGKL